MKQHFLAAIIIGLSWAIAPNVHAAGMCSEIYNRPVVPDVEKVVISEEAFHQSTKDLRDTLVGKLATVWRSEWKTKLSLALSNQYVLDITNALLTPQTRDAVLSGLDVNSPGFTQAIHARLFQLQTENKIQTDDDLMVRDMPAPPGAKDTTFTYYTKPLVSATSDGKHQLRVRTYLREVFFEQIPVGQSIKGFDAEGRDVEILRDTESSYKIKKIRNGQLQATLLLSAAQVKARFGQSLHIFAPHGKSFKMEVKTALEDNIFGENFPRLGGQHMVQKLDVSLSPAQVNRLFAPLQGTKAQRLQESMNRVETISKEVIAKKPETQSRVEAVFNVVKQGIRSNPDYLVIEGATFYHRTAFESKSGFQTTIDREQAVFAGQMYNQNSSLKDPAFVVRNNVKIVPTDDAARHVELKVPVTSIQNTAGVQFQDPASAPAPANTENDGQIRKVEGIYHNYVKNNDHPGKFNFIRRNGEN